MGNANSSISKSKRHGQTAKVASTEPQHVVPRHGKPSSTKAEVEGFPRDEGHGTKDAAFRGEYSGKPKAETPGPLRGQHQHGAGVYSEQQGKQSSLDSDDTFTEYIRRAKYKIRTLSNIGRDQNNPAPAPAPAPAPDVANGTNNKENQKDQFADFIQLAKKKLRTKSTIGKNNSLKRG